MNLLFPEVCFLYSFYVTSALVQWNSVRISWTCFDFELKHVLSTCTVRFCIGCWQGRKCGRRELLIVSGWSTWFCGPSVSFIILPSFLSVASWKSHGTIRGKSKIQLYIGLIPNGTSICKMSINISSFWCECFFNIFQMISISLFLFTHF